MTTITKERIELFIKNPLENGLTRSEQMEVARIALASLEADPIGEVSEKRYGLIMDGTVDLGGKSTYRIIKGEKAMKLFPLGTKFYTAPSAPVSVPDLKPVGFLFVSDDGSVAYSPAGWPMKGFNLIGPIYGDVNACRAAMLQAEPVSNSDELPLDYLQGHKDGLEWAAQLAEANHPQTGDWLYDDPIDLARAIRKGPDMPTVQGGNSPVIPDDVRRMDWLVSKTVDVREPMVYGSHSLFWSQTITDEEDDYHATKLREQIDAAMAAEQAAAPQQEAE